MSQVESESSGFAKRAVSFHLDRRLVAASFMVCTGSMFLAPASDAAEPTATRNSLVGPAAPASPATTTTTPEIAPHRTSAVSQSPSPGERLNAGELTAILKESTKKSSSSSASHVLGSGPNVTVMALPAAAAKDRDLKIDAVFYAKTLIESAPHQIERVDVIFSEARAEDSKFISIDKKAIKTYGEGNMSAEIFLSSLHLMPVNADEPPAVEQGPFRERRLLICDRIETLRKNGTGVQPFQTIFQSIESAIKGGDTTQLSARLEDLEEKLTEQEEQVAIAKRTALGHGVMTRPRRPSGRGEAPDPSSRFLELEKSGSIGRLMNNSPNFSKLQDLKRMIDERVKSGLTNDARPMMEEFLRIVEQEHPHLNQVMRRNENQPGGGFNGRLGGRL